MAFNFSIVDDAATIDAFLRRIDMNASRKEYPSASVSQSSSNPQQHWSASPADCEDSLRQLDDQPAEPYYHEVKDLSFADTSATSSPQASSVSSIKRYDKATLLSIGHLDTGKGRLAAERLKAYLGDRSQATISPVVRHSSWQREAALPSSLADLKEVIVSDNQRLPRPTDNKPVHHEQEQRQQQQMHPMETNLLGSRNYRPQNLNLGPTLHDLDDNQRFMMSPPQVVSPPASRAHHRASLSAGLSNGSSQGNIAPHNHRGLVSASSSHSFSSQHVRRFPEPDPEFEGQVVTRSSFCASFHSREAPRNRKRSVSAR
ncbi:hypothetical protein MRB53_041620 [Persea americana]|nr:hypothetical protein MRB53_041620 [Persea americana]